MGRENFFHRTTTAATARITAADGLRRFRAAPVNNGKSVNPYFWSLKPMSLLKTMIKHTAGEQEASAGCEPPIITTATTAARHLCLHRARCSRVEDARDWPEDREIDGTLCRRLSPEYFAWLRSRMLTAQAAHKAGKLPEDAWNTLRKRFNRPDAGHPGVRQGTPAGSTALFFPKNYQPPALRPEPRRNPSKFPERTGFIPGTKQEM